MPDLKSMWKKAFDDNQERHRTEEEILKIVKGKTSGVIKKIRNKLIIETGIYLVLTYAFVDLFDAFDKNLVIVLFATSLITLGILNNIIFYRFLRIKILNEDLSSFLDKTIKRLKVQLYFRTFFFALFILSMLLVLIPDDLSLMVTTKRGLIFMIVAVISILIKATFENHQWREHIKNLSQSQRYLLEE